MSIRVVVMLQNPREVAAAQAAQARAQAQEAAQQAREQARDAAQQARDQAEAARDVARAKLDAARAEQEAQRIGDASDGNTTVVTVTKDGVTMTLKDASPEAIATALGMPSPNESNDAWMAIPVTGIMMTAITLITWMVLRYRIRMRGAASPAALPADLTDRLSRMEAGIESTAVEVERISEGQRFTTRLLAERPQGEEVRRG